VEIIKFSANLGFLWAELELPDAILAAKAAGFDAVECHWPYDTDPKAVYEALQKTNISALPGREDEARAAIDEAISYATKIKAKNIHVMAGISAGEEAEKVFLKNLNYACSKAIIKKIDYPNLKLMFDCYHVQLMEGNIVNKLNSMMPFIGHIQFASVPDRGEPESGELSYDFIFKTIQQLNYKGPIGAEYKPMGDTNLSLGWMK